VADVIIAGERDVDLATALGALAERGYARVLAEGGPTLNGQLAAAGLLDELCLTLSPLLAGGEAKRILAGPVLLPGPSWRLRSLCEQDGFLFLRYRPQ
jgi:riboflavin biosynthesis pyrimidine reductase